MVSFEQNGQNVDSFLPTDQQVKGNLCVQLGQINVGPDNRDLSGTLNIADTPFFAGLMQIRPRCKYFPWASVEVGWKQNCPLVSIVIYSLK